MAFLITLNESAASRRCVPIWLVGSNGTSPATGESGITFHFAIGGFHYGSGGSLSVVSAAAGEYVCAFAASKLSVLGPGTVYYQSGNAIPASSPFQVVKFDSNNSEDLGLNAFSQVSIHAGTHSSVTIQGVSNISAAVDVISDITGGVWYAGNRSGVSVEVKSGGIQTTSVGAGSYSGVSMEVKTGGIQTTSIGAGNYSTMSVRIQAGDYGSHTTFGTSTIKAGSYSGVSVGVLDIKPASYSGVSVEIKTGGIQAVSFGAGAVDAAAISTDAGQEIADALLGRNIAGGSSTGRVVSQAFYTLRNRTFVSGSTGTVYQIDDTTSSWTFSIATVASQAINELDPGGT